MDKFVEVYYVPVKMIPRNCVRSYLGLRLYFSIVILSFGIDLVTSENHVVQDNPDVN